MAALLPSSRGRLAAGARAPALLVLLVASSAAAAAAAAASFASLAPPGRRLAPLPRPRPTSSSSSRCPRAGRIPSGRAGPASSSSSPSWSPGPTEDERGPAASGAGRLDGGPGRRGRRRRFLADLGAPFLLLLLASSSSSAPPPSAASSTDVDEFLRTGMVPNPTGASGQAGKSRPVTGVALREGSQVSRDAATGAVLAEILLLRDGGAAPSAGASDQGDSEGEGGLVPVAARFSSPWPLATGSAFDVECRDPSTGDGAFLQVTEPRAAAAGDGDALLLSDSFLVGQLASPTGRFALYGAPTDVRVRGSRTFAVASAEQGRDGAAAPSSQLYKVLDVSFSIVSQSTQSELPRRALVAATVPRGTRQAVMLVASSSAGRWANRGAGEAARRVADSFAAAPAPPTRLKVRRAAAGRGPGL